ncbi:Recombination endonuclease VII [Geodermatophilus siccatus]|uniref:Recombination endonuclease VII n=1 Tax=Geodermatophilus siccatus TaxID=1137991 RepID=A0A1H0AP35_9ACTN|nr:endonuclease domain-containing protein [Geodermatophilus siccatus]SDN35135.1 Recombination endonuclease VII [Geodermatophilus siccatus]
MRDLPAARGRAAGAHGGRPRRDGSPAAPSAKLVVDHCHEGGGNRGLLCVDCNWGLGNFADDVAGLRAAVRYLQRHADD